MKMLEKLQKRLQEGKKDNKGFSLVELIIVIAIMAILVGIVGMTVIPQIENSRKATDEQVLSALCTEAVEAYTQAVYAEGKYTITIAVESDGTLKDAAVSAGDDGDAALAQKLEDKMNELGSTRKLKSNAGKALSAEADPAGTGIKIVCDGTADESVILTAAGFEDITVR